MNINENTTSYKESTKILPARSALMAAQAQGKEQGKEGKRRRGKPLDKPHARLSGDIKTKQRDFLAGFAKLAQVTQFDFARAHWIDGEVAQFVQKDLQDIEYERVPAILAHLRARNYHGQDVYFRPARGHAAAVLLIDDVPKARALSIAGKYRAYVVETSPDRCHVWIGTDRVLDEDERFQAQKHIVQALNQNDGHVADPNSVSGEHFGRLPGCRTYKRGPDAAVWVNVIAEPDQDAPLYSPVFALAADPAPLSPTRRACGSSPRQGSTGCRSAARSNKGGRDESSAEWGFVMGQLENGVAPNVVEERLLQHCRERRGRDAERYARYTVQRALSRGTTH